MKWETTTLGKVSASIQTGPFGSQLHQSDYSETGTPVVMPKDLVGGKISTESIARVAESHVERLSRHKIIPGDILYSRRGDVGRCAYASEAEENWLCGTGCLRVTIDQDKADPKFIFYQLQTAKSIGWVEKHAVGATMLNLNTSILCAVPVTLPPLNVQNQIADILSAYDELIENNQNQIKLLEEAAQRLYKEWFVDLRFPGYETTPIVDDTPEGWERVDIDSHITLYSGFAFKSADFCDEGQYKLVTIKNVKDAQFISENVSFLKEIPARMPDYCKLKDGDILLSLTGNVGRVCLVYGEDYLLNQRVAKLESLFPSFTYCLFRSKDMFDAMSNLANGAAQQNLSPIRTGKINALFPNASIMQKFETQIVPMLQKIVLLNKEIIAATAARDRLLPKLMSGEIEV